MTVLGAALLLLLAVVALRRRGLAWVIAVAAALPISAAFGVGGNTLSLFYCSALAAVVVVLSGRGSRNPGRWTTTAYAGFLVVAIVIGALAPWLFRGMSVLSARGGIDEQVLDPDALAYTVSGVAQLVYVLLAAAVVVAIGRLRPPVAIVDAMFATGIGLSFVRFALRTVGVDPFGALIDTAQNVAIGDGGGTRFRGVMAEPSEFAAFALPAAVYFVLASRSGGVRARVLRIVGAVVACVMLLAASSGTALVASMIVMGALLVVVVVRFLVRGTAAPQIVLGALAVAVVLVLVGPQVVGTVQSLVLEKVDSQSYSARSASNGITLHIVAESLGLGVGLGNNRPSSMALTVLSGVGVVGTVCFVVFLIGILRRAFRDPERIPVAVALLAIVVAKVVAAPDLSTPALWVLVAVVAATPDPVPETRDLPLRSAVPGRSTAGALTEGATLRDRGGRGWSRGPTPVQTRGWRR